MKLYYFPQTRAARVRWCLEELGVPYEVAPVNLLKGEHKQPDYMKIHPLGVVPALEDGGQTLIESAAIIMHLADKYPDMALAPAPGSPERAEYYQWILFAMTEMDPQLVAVLMHTRFLPEADRVPALIERAKHRFNTVASVVEQRLQGREYLVGNKFSAADVVMGAVFHLGKNLGMLSDSPTLRAYEERMMARSSAQKVYAS